MRKSRIISVGVLLFWGLALSVKANEADPVKLEFYTWESEQPYISAIVDTFNSSQNRIVVDANFIDDAMYDDGVVEMLKSGVDIDLVGVRGIACVNQMYEDDLLYDLTDVIKESAFDITCLGNMYNHVAIDGRYYALPTRSTSWMLIYNKEIFDSEKMEYPENLTWDEYRSLAKSLTKSSESEVQWGGYWVPWVYNFYGILNHNYLYDDDLTYCRQSLEMLNAFYNEDKSHVSYQETAGGNDWLEAFAQGNIAMMPQGEWSVGLLMEAEKEGKISFEWDIATMPHMDEARNGSTWGQYQFSAITSSCKEKDAAEEFLLYIGGEAGAKIYAEHGIISAYANNDIRSTYIEAVGNKNVEVFFDALRIQEQPNYAQYQEIMTIFDEVAEKYLSGSKSLDEVMNEFEQRRYELLAFMERIQ